MYEYAQMLVPVAKKIKPKSGDKTDLSVMQTDWGRLKSDMKSLFDKFVVRDRILRDRNLRDRNLRDRNLRVGRINLANQVLSDGKDVGERLLAALALDMDGDLLPQLLAKDETFPAEQTEKVKETIKHAREAGAILGTFTTLPSPFEVVGPTKWEMAAYRELLMDGAQTHYWAIANDPNAPSSNTATDFLRAPGPEMLAYIRRLNLARSMLNAAAMSNAKTCRRRNGHT